MTADPRNVPAPPDALAWIWSGGRDTPHWATTGAEIKEAHRRGERMLPTGTDRRGRRVVRNVAEYTHLADHLALATTVHHLAYAIDRVRLELEEAALENAEPDEDAPTDDNVERPATGAAAYPPSAQRPPTLGDDPADAEVSQQWPGARSSVPDPEDALMAIMGIFERGTRQYRDADTTIPGFRELWDRLDGDDKNLLQTYEAAANRNTDLWGDDRFRLGYALGASGLLGFLESHT